MSYRERLQKIILELQNCYDESERLRDMSTLEDKVYWNRFRLTVMAAWQPLQTLDNGLSDSHARMEID